MYTYAYSFVQSISHVSFSIHFSFLGPPSACSLSPSLAKQKEGIKSPQAQRTCGFWVHGEVSAPPSRKLTASILRSIAGIPAQAMNTKQDK